MVPGSLGIFTLGTQPAEGTHVRARTAGLRCREAAARTAFSRPKFKIQDSKFKISCCLEPDSQPRSRAVGLHERTCGPRDCNPPPGGGCGLRRFSSGPQIQDSKLDGAGLACVHRFGTQPAERACSGTNCGPPLPEGCGPLRPYGRNSLFKIQDSKLAAGCLRHLFFSRQPRSRAVGLHERTCGTQNAALRPGAAAGCRLLCNRTTSGTD